MSSAGTIFRETVFPVEATSAGTKTLEFDVENDGCIVVIERLTGEALIQGELSSVLPSDMSPVVHSTFLVDVSTPVTVASITYRRAKLVLSWNSAISCKVAIKLASATGIETAQGLAVTTATLVEDQKIRATQHAELLSSQATIQDSLRLLNVYMALLLGDNIDC